SDREEAARHGQRHLVARADRDDTGDELLEERAIALLAQLEERRLRERLDRLADPLDGAIDVEGTLLARRLSPWRPRRADSCGASRLFNSHRGTSPSSEVVSWRTGEIVLFTKSPARQLTTSP